MADIAQLIDDYIAAWNETDAGRRRALVGQVFTDDATYLDPVMEGNGADGIDAMIAGAQAQFPGARFELAGALTPTTTWCASRGTCTRTAAKRSPPVTTTAGSRPTDACAPSPASSRRKGLGRWGRTTSAGVGPT
jgi:hypothetical protein